MQGDGNKVKGGQIVYLSHGGGPLPLLGDAGHRSMVDFMGQLPSRLRRPEAILVISAHWEEAPATILGARQPGLYYDYYGFPDAAYSIEYPSPGNPELAREVVTVLENNGLSATLDLERGFDHGVFIPLKLMYPGADIPVTQLSLLKNLDAAAHFELGLVLRILMTKNILVIGSGFSFHNMEAFSRGGDNRPDRANDAFQDWLIATCTGPMQQAGRRQRLIDWEQAPSARYCHPREEHLLPLHVCMGLADGPASLIFDDYILGKRSVAFLAD